MTGFVAITPELLTQILKGLRDGQPPRYFQITRNPLPQDAEFCGFRIGTDGRLQLIFESGDFEAGAELEFVPKVSVRDEQSPLKPREYRRRNTVVEAVLWQGDMQPIIDMLGHDLPTAGDQSVWVTTNHGDVRAELGSWILKGFDGEAYPCSDSVFRKNYEVP